MIPGAIVRAWRTDETASVAVRVAGDGLAGEAVEYIASVPVAELAGLSLTRQRAALVEAARRERAARRALAGYVAEDEELGFIGAVSL